MKKTAHAVLHKVFSEILLKLDRLNEAQEQNNQQQEKLIVGLITEERQRAEVQKFGGVMRISDNEIATKLFNGAIMYLNPHDIAVVPHIVFESIWEAQITKAWIRLIEKDREMTILDIGANFGYFGMLAAQYSDKLKAKIFLFEPNINLIPYINKNLSVNWLNENTNVVNRAVSDKNGEAVLNVLEDYTGSSSMHDIEKLDRQLSHKMHIKAEEQQRVVTTTIDAFCEENGLQQVDLVKMDIEGYEEKAYSGMRGVVKKSKKITMFVEFTKDGYENPEEFFSQMLEDFGNVYLIDTEGKLQTPKVKSYQAIAGKEKDWVMLVFSKLSREQLG